MTKLNFFEKHKHLNLSEQEIQRKYNLYVYEQQQLEMISSFTVGGGKSSATPPGGGGIPPEPDEE